MCLLHGSDSTYPIIKFYKQRHKLLYYIHTYLSSQSSEHHENGSISVSLTGQTAFLSMWRGYATLHLSQAWCVSWAWLALVSVINLLPYSYSHKSHIQFPYDYHMMSKSSYTCLTLWAHDTFHKYIYELWLLFLFFLLLARQVSWPRSLMSGTLSESFPSVFYFISMLHLRTLYYRIIYYLLSFIILFFSAK